MQFTDELAWSRGNGHSCLKARMFRGAISFAETSAVGAR